MGSPGIAARGLPTRVGVASIYLSIVCVCVRARVHVRGCMRADMDDLSNINVSKPVSR